MQFICSPRHRRNSIIIVFIAQMYAPAIRRHPFQPPFIMFLFFPIFFSRLSVIFFSLCVCVLCLNWMVCLMCPAAIRIVQRRAREYEVRHVAMSVCLSAFVIKLRRVKRKKFHSSEPVPV